MTDVFALQKRTAAEIFAQQFEDEELRDDIAGEMSEEEASLSLDESMDVETKKIATEEDAAVDFDNLLEEEEDVDLGADEDVDDDAVDFDNLPEELKQFIDNEEDDSSSDESVDETSPLEVFFAANLYDSVLRGKKWTGDEFVDVERITCDAEEFPYTNLLLTSDSDDPDYIFEKTQLQTFFAEHAARVEKARAASSTFSHLYDVLENVMAINEWCDLASKRSKYRFVHITYNDCNTIGGVYRPAIIEVPAKMGFAYLLSVWFVANIRLASRVAFFSSIDTMIADNAKIGDNLFDLIYMVQQTADERLPYNTLPVQYARSWSIIEDS